MTNYTKTMGEALESMYISEDNVAILRDIVKRKSIMSLKFADGKMKVDLFTASAVTQALDKVNPANKAKITKLINTGKKANFASIAKVVMKSENNPEIEEEVKVEEVSLLAQQAAILISKRELERNPRKEEVELDELMPPSRHVGKSEKTPDMFAVYDQKGKEVKLFKDEGDAKEYAVKNHEALMGHDKPKKEEDDLDEAMLRDRDYEYDEKEGVVKISKNNFAKVKKDSKGTDKSKPTMMVLTKKGTSLVPVKFTEEVDLGEALEQYVVMAGPGDNNQKILDIFKGAGSALKKAKKVRDDWNTKNKSKIKLDKKGKPIAAHMARIVNLASTAGLDGVPIKKGDDISYSQFNHRIVKEEVDLDEGKMSQLHQYIKDKKSAEQIAKLMKVDVKTIKILMSSNQPEGVDEVYEIGTDEYANYTKDLTPGQGEEIDEARPSARADAKRAMGRRSKKDSADDDNIATDDDRKAADKNILMQLRKATNLGGKYEVEFKDKKKVKVKPAIAMAFIKKHEKMKPVDKTKLQDKASKSYKDLLTSLKEEDTSMLGRIEKKLKEIRNG